MAESRTLRLLRTVFGYVDFRQRQEKIVDRLVNGGGVLDNAGRQRRVVAPPSAGTGGRGLSQ